MAGDQREIEVKFFVMGLAPIEARLQSLGAVQIQPRIHEYNLRFDTPSGSLARQFKVLRLRRDSASYLTFKGPNTVVDGVSQREEIEFTLDDFESARALLEGLGYQVSMVYEKYRAVYQLETALVTLDEMPFGRFVEIEGPQGSAIQQISLQLGLDWEARIVDSYAYLFQVVRNALGLDTLQLTFKVFSGIQVTASHLGVHPADV